MYGEKRMYKSDTLQKRTSQKPMSEKNEKKWKLNYNSNYGPFDAKCLLLEAIIFRDFEKHKPKRKEKPIGINRD